jgi:hypothetical protein
MRFTKMVINSSFLPVGFIYVENGRERYEDFASLCRRNATDGRLTFGPDGVFGLYKYKENEIEVCRETACGGFSAPIDPGITLTARVMSGNKYVGFVVRDGTGKESKKRLESVLSAAKYLKPVNFHVIERDGKRSVRGAAGAPLSALPVINVTPALDSGKPRGMSAPVRDTVGQHNTGGASLIDLMEIASQHNGWALKLPSDAYKPVGEVHVADDEAFTRMGNACEVARAQLIPSKSKLTASLRYRVPGYVMTTEGPVLTYIFRTKNIVNLNVDNGVIRGDKVRLGRMGLAVEKANAAEFYSSIEGTVAVEPFEDKSLLLTAVKLLKMNEPETMVVDLTEIPLLGSIYHDYLLSADNIKAYVEAANDAKFTLDACKVILNENTTSGGAKEIWPSYRKFSGEMLDEIALMGVDISTGTFVKTGASRANEDALKKGAVVEITYEINGLMTAPKTQITSVGDVPASQQDIWREFFSLPMAGRITKAIEMQETAENMQRAANMTLFKHKLAAVLSGNGALAGHPSSEWESAAVRANALFKRYTHANGVSVKLRNIEMA